MKKLYIKPDLTFESFQLSRNIAANCSQEMIDFVNAHKAMDPDLFTTDIACNNTDLSKIGLDGYCVTLGLNQTLYTS